MRAAFRLGLIALCFVSASACLHYATNQSKTEEPVMQLVWSDEFDYEGLPDSSRWGYDRGDGCPKLCGWGNNELQYYTENRMENARVGGGILTIEAHREAMNGRDFSSARLVSKGKGDWQYGTIKIRARLPKGKGVWPAIWMLPTDKTYGGWPDCGEIDIMEHVGYIPDSTFGTVHTRNYNGMIGTQVVQSHYMNDVTEKFHEYGISWTPEQIDFLIDDTVFHRFINDGKGYKSWPFDQKFHLLLNVAVGGNWGGKHGIDESIWPQKMEIDYVRVYQQATNR